MDTAELAALRDKVLTICYQPGGVGRLRKASGLAADTIYRFRINKGKPSPSTLSRLFSATEEILSGNERDLPYRTVKAVEEFVSRNPSLQESEICQGVDLPTADISQALRILGWKPTVVTIEDRLTAIERRLAALEGHHPPGMPAGSPFERPLKWT